MFSCLHPNCPARFEHYVKVGELAAGGQGIAYLVKDRQNRSYCMKKISLPDSTVNPEIRVANRSLNSPFLVDFYHCFVKEREAYILMEYCSGGSLFDFIKNHNTYSEQDIWDIFSQLVLGLSYLHGNGILHRDVKPGNILLVSKTRPLRIKLCDFGIARELYATTIASEVGTELFRAPETFGNTPYSTPVDLWSLGVVLYQLVHNRYPFDCTLAILNNTPDIAASPFSEIIKKLLNKDPASRPTARQLCLVPQVDQFQRNFRNMQTSSQVNGLQQQIQVLQAENNQLKVTINLLNSRIQGEQTNRNFKDKLEQQQRVNREQHEVNRSLRNKVADLESTNESLKRQVCDLEVANTKLVQENSDLACAVQSLNNQDDQWRSTNEDQFNARKQLEKKLKQKDEEIARLKRELDQASQSLQINQNNSENRRHNDQWGYRVNSFKPHRHNSRRNTVEPVVTSNIDVEPLIPEFSSEKILHSLRHPVQVAPQPHVRLSNPNRRRNTVRFLQQGKGKDVHLSESDCMATKQGTGWNDSFVQINAPRKGQLVLTLDNDVVGTGLSFIGFVDRSHCNQRDFYTGATVLHLTADTTQFYVNYPTLLEETCSMGLVEGEDVVINFFENGQVDFYIPSLDKHYDVNWPLGYVFGIAMYQEGTVWCVSES
ncbi:hypothetical protein RCL1_006241 [Eukaryota sp. TZLM3-RCL]